MESKIYREDFIRCLCNIDEQLRKGVSMGKKDTALVDMMEIRDIVHIKVVYMSILCISVILTNITVILTLLLRRNMISISTKYFLYIMNLAVCDLFVGAFLIPVYIAMLLGKKRLNNLNSA